MNISHNIFHHDKLFTIGIEEEYMLCDPDSGELINRADEIMNLLDDQLKHRYSYELILSEIEVNTSVCHSVNEAVKEISLLRNNTRMKGEFRNCCQLTFKINKNENSKTWMDRKLLKNKAE